MISAPLSQNEDKRLRALLSYDIMDTAAEKEFDDLVRLASQICESEISLVSLIDAKRQWFKAKVGLEAEQTDRNIAFCAHAILQDDIFEVENARKDERFQDNPLVADEDGLKIRFYAGMPLKNPEGLNLGTLCVIDKKPKKLTEVQRFALKTLGNQVVTQLELRLKFRNLQEEMAKVQAAQKQLVETEKMVTLGKLAANVAHEINTPLGAIRTSADNSVVTFDELLPRLSSFLKSLSEEKSEIFNQAIAYATQAREGLSTKQKRAIKYEIISQLEEQEIDEEDVLADYIVELGLHNKTSLYEPLLQTKDPTYTFRVLFQLAAIVKNNKNIKTATDKASKIIFALKNFSRQDQRGEKSLVNINKSLEETLTLYQNYLRADIVLNLELKDLPQFMGYPDELTQVWTNLIHNALQAMKYKGELNISSSLVENKKAIVKVVDTGTGIPKQICEKIFDPFFTTKLTGEGCGLGLDITRKIVEKHNGKIWFETEEGKGTTFFIELPIT